MVVHCTGQGEGHAAEPGVRQHCPLLHSVGCRYTIQIYCVSKSGVSGHLVSEEVIEGYCPAVKQPFPALGGLGLCLIPYLGCSRKVLVATLGLSQASVCACESNQLAKMVSQTPSATMSTGLCYFACAQQLLQPL